jgi:transposase
MTDQMSWFVGVDWATQEHRVCLLDAEGNKVAERNVPHGGDGLTQLCDWLLEQTRAQTESIAVAIETPRGPVVEALLERGFAVFSVNPKQLDRFRDRFSVAGAKDDSRDAEALASSLRTDRRAFRRLTVDDPLVIELREWTRIHDELTQERVRLANRMREQLWRYYPQARDLSDDLAADWFLDLWQQVPTPAQAARTSEKTIARILKQHRIRRLDAGTVLRALRAQPLTVAPGTSEAASAHIRTLAVRARLINAQLKEAQHRLDELCGAIEAAAETSPGQICEQRDVAILRSFPGLGRITLAALRAEASEPLRRRDYHSMRTLTGAAPVTRRSGKACFVVRRHACNKRLAQAIFHWARSATQHDPISAKRYDELRRRGHSHGRALRGVADRLLYVLCTLLERQVLFDRNYQVSQMVHAA